ncbi:hypothetical protein CHUAL_008640 [Chamberlinius hualienensis]
MIEAVIINSKAYLFESEGVDKLRREYRIVGSLVGCFSRAPKQNKQHGLPLLLMPEEATMLAEKGIIRLVWYERLRGEPTSNEMDEINKLREESFAEQAVTVLKNEERRKELENFAKKIEEGRKKRLKTSHAKEQSDFTKDLKNVPPADYGNEITSADSMMVQLFVGCPWLNKTTAVPADWHYPRTAAQKMRLRVYTDLYDKGYYITTGGKFGGDYLLYPGDPVQYHASHIAICVPQETELSGYDIIAKGRLGSTVKKTVVLCSPAEDGLTVKYLTIKWSGDYVKNRD